MDIIEKAARTAHEVNNAYRRGLGEDPSGAWNSLSSESREGTLAGVRHVHKNPNVKPYQLHNLWVAKKRADGWDAGPLDLRAKKHPNMVPFHELPRSQQVKDELFLATVLGVLSME